MQFHLRAVNTMDLRSANPLVSIILPIRNGEHWIEACLESIVSQTVLNVMKLEISICDDCSTDRTLQIIDAWKSRLKNKPISLKIYKDENSKPRGVGHAKNRAVENSTGEYLCFQDVDDVMLPCRVQAQYDVAKRNKNAIIGGQFKRMPETSTARFSKWANTLTSEQLELQVYTSNGPTIVMPTWFCHRTVFNRIGGFSEAGHGCPEDLIFFYQHLDNGGRIIRVDVPMVIYTYHPQATTFSVCEKTIWDLRVARLQEQLLPRWNKFTIWNAGKQGRRLYRSLVPKFQENVVAFCDVDQSKIGQNYIPYDPERRIAGRPIPIIHYKDAKAPFIICVKLDMTNGELEANLQSFHLREGIDYVHFS